MKLNLKSKLVLSLSSIAVVLLISSIISVVEYRSMSTYVSDMIADNVNSVNVARKMSDVCNRYNLDILSVIGDDAKNVPPKFDYEEFLSRCDSLRASITGKTLMPLADAVEYSYSAYMLTSLELEEVLKSDYIDSRTWYFKRLQPRFERLNADIDALSEAVYQDLSNNSETFDNGFYRSIIPGIVAVGVGILLVVLLMFYLLSYYVRPICRMRDSLAAYKSVGKKYTCTFDGDDELAELNNDIGEISSENSQLRKRLLDR